ncbi:hypothetical protein SKAU_G00251270 [Synaphobranchus kaupii]|uniref:Uncharacterized protein n=1 Tax=Synaphobranchus kaupii TaxID=118154 RepID=A0A9Q1F3A2_SYNKA|nr:hypothetical protein SKAU_G00251270 [Synaphobranchus kaupii]
MAVNERRTEGTQMGQHAPDPCKNTQRPLLTQATPRLDDVIAIVRGYGPIPPGGQTRCHCGPFVRAGFVPLAVGLLKRRGCSPMVLCDAAAEDNVAAARLAEPLEAFDKEQ